jgi:hypothetical protein
MMWRGVLLKDTFTPHHVLVVCWLLDSNPVSEDI